MDSGFTAEEDAKIVELKANGRTWAQIAQELGGGRTKGDITHRYKQVTTNQKSEEKDHAKKDENKEKKHDEKAQHQMSNKEKKRAAKAEKDREEGLKKKEEAAKAKDGETSKAAEEVKEPVAEAESTKVRRTCNAVVLFTKKMNSLQQMQPEKQVELPQQT